MYRKAIEMPGTANTQTTLGEMQRAEHALQTEAFRYAHAGKAAEAIRLLRLTMGDALSLGLLPGEHCSEATSLFWVGGRPLYFRAADDHKGLVIPSIPREQPGFAVVRTGASGRLEVHYVSGHHPLPRRRNLADPQDAKAAALIGAGSLLRSGVLAPLYRASAELMVGVQRALRVVLEDRRIGILSGEPALPDEQGLQMLRSLPPLVRGQPSFPN